MIKLIASDLDGTLLTPDHKLPIEIFKKIEELSKKNILFCVASGRQYANLKKLFFPLKNQVIFLAENGGLVYYQEKQLYCSSLPMDRLKEILMVIRSIPNLYPMLCGTDYAYIENDCSPFADNCKMYYDHCLIVNNLEDVIGKEPICKVAVWDPIGSATYGGKILPPLLPDFRVITSGFDWCDVSSYHTNKGLAMQYIQEYFSLKKEECIAFGDQMNDLELLQACKYGFVTENGLPQLKEKIGRIIPSCAEKGVIQTIDKILKNDFPL